MTNEQAQAKKEIDKELGGLRSLIRSYRSVLTEEQKTQVEDSLRGILREIRLAKSHKVKLQLAITNKG